MTDDVEFRYKYDNVFNKPAEGGMRYDAVDSEWDKYLEYVNEPVLSKKAKKELGLEESDNQFSYEERC